VAKMGGSRLHCIRVRERRRRSRISIRNHTPGVVIGSAWAALGLKRGLPLFASTFQAVVSPSEKIALGLRTIRRRQLLAFMSLLAWLPIAVTILPQISEKLLATVLFLTAAPVGAFFTVWTLTACPRCGRHFYPVLRPWLFMSLNRCHGAAWAFTMLSARRIGLTTRCSRPPRRRLNANVRRSR